MNTGENSQEDFPDIIIDDNALSDDEFNELEEMEKDKEEEDNLLRTEIKRGDFVLVKLKGKKRCLHYVAEIVNVVGSSYIINYLHKTNNNKFIDGKEDHDEITDSDIVRKLPFPTLSGASERQVSQISFPINFSSYILG